MIHGPAAFRELHIQPFSFQRGRFAVGRKMEKGKWG